MSTNQTVCDSTTVYGPGGGGPDTPQAETNKLLIGAGVLAGGFVVYKTIKGE